MLNQGTLGLLVDVAREALGRVTFQFAWQPVAVLPSQELTAFRWCVQGASL